MYNTVGVQLSKNILRGRSLSATPPKCVARFLTMRERGSVAVSYIYTNRRGVWYVGGSLARALLCKQGEMLRKSGLFVGVIRVNQQYVWHCSSTYYCSQPRFCGSSSNNEQSNVCHPIYRMAAFCLSSSTRPKCLPYVCVRP